MKTKTISSNSLGLPILPSPMNEAEAPADFEMSLEALLRCRVPNNHDPNDVILFSFKRLETVPNLFSNVNPLKIIECPERGRAVCQCFL